MPEVHSTKPRRRCEFDGCDKLRTYKRFCPAHQRQWESGKQLTRLYIKKRQNGTPPRIEYAEIPCANPSLDGPCHVFRGVPNNHGYAHTSHNGKTIAIHRYVWEQTNGPIPAGLEIDHQCRNRMCCNVNHLRVVTHRINAIENSLGVSATAAAQTHCKHGHPFDEENTRLYHNQRTGKKQRCCRACKRNERKRHV